MAEKICVNCATRDQQNMIRSSSHRYDRYVVTFCLFCLALVYSVPWIVPGFWSWFFLVSTTVVIGGTLFYIMWPRLGWMCRRYEFWLTADDKRNIHCHSAELHDQKLKSCRQTPCLLIDEEKEYEIISRNNSTNAIYCRLGFLGCRAVIYGPAIWHWRLIILRWGRKVYLVDKDSEYMPVLPLLQWKLQPVAKKSENDKFYAYDINSVACSYLIFVLDSYESVNKIREAYCDMHAGEIISLKAQGNPAG